jgi:vacuolar-type H+-ATPase subunit I/STV1
MQTDYEISIAVSYVVFSSHSTNLKTVKEIILKLITFDFCSYRNHRRKHYKCLSVLVKMNIKRFDIGFIGFFMIVFGTLFYLYKRANSNSGELTGFWAALIIIFLIFGVIIVSMYVKYIRESSSNRKISSFRSS